MEEVLLRYLVLVPPDEHINPIIAVVKDQKTMIDTHL